MVHFFDRNTGPCVVVVGGGGGSLVVDLAVSFGCHDR